MSKPKPDDDTAEIVEAARTLCSQFEALMTVSRTLSGVADLRAELAKLELQRDQVMDELETLWGERDTELAALTEQIEAGLKAKYEESERLLATNEAMRAEFQDLKTQIAERNAVLTNLEGRVMRAEAQHADIAQKLATLKGSIAA